jgi:hypothetical protein
MGRGLSISSEVSRYSFPEIKVAVVLSRCDRSSITGEKKDLLLKARFEALQAEGGKRAIKKAIEKKQKKVAGKEKKSRPFAKGAFGGGGGGGGGDAGGGADGGPRKRRKVG